MTGYRLTPAAQRDLSSMWDYSERRWSTRQAELYINEIRAAIERIAADPGRGHPCNDVREGYRRYGVGSHVLFYVESTEAVDVIRILHQRMDPSRNL